MIAVLAGGVLLILYMALGHPEVWDQSDGARTFAVFFLYPWLLIVGYWAGRRARKQQVEQHYLAQCGYCGASELIPGNIKPEDREAWAIRWANKHNKERHPQ